MHKIPYYLALETHVCVGYGEACIHPLEADGCPQSNFGSDTDTDDATHSPTGCE